MTDFTQQTKDTLINLAGSDKYEYVCHLYCDTVDLYDGETFEFRKIDYRRNGKGRRVEITLEWEKEYSDYSVIGSYPVFTVEPPCAGPPTYDDHSFPVERNPERCPFHEYFGDVSPEQLEILAAYRERQAFKRIIERTMR